MMGMQLVGKRIHQSVCQSATERLRESVRLRLSQSVSGSDESVRSDEEIRVG